MPVGSGNSKRFTRDGSDALEEELRATCARIGEEVRELIPGSKLEGLVLAGGYGRGEGGVLKTEMGDQPYNDLEFYVFVRGFRPLAERVYQAPLQALGERLSPAVGIDVEFKVLTRQCLAAAAPSMFYYDLVCGRHWVLGDDSLLAGCDHHRQSRSIPLHEALRLLMNRCSGLLFSAERLRRARFGPEESDFVGRNLAKAQLALGDVLLSAAGEYHWSCLERRRRLSQLKVMPSASWFQRICGHHAAGVEFKLHPMRSMASREVLAKQHAELCALAGELWLWLESRRLGVSFANLLEYAFSAIDKCPETSSFKNRLVNAKSFGPWAAFGAPAIRYPRQRLLHALCLLLWHSDAVEGAPVRQRIQRELRATANDFSGLVSAYEQLWNRFN